MGILKALEIVSAAFVLAFILLALVAAVTTAILQAKDRRKLKRQQEQARPKDHTVWTDVQVLRR